MSGVVFNPRVSIFRMSNPEPAAAPASNPATVDSASDEVTTSADDFYSTKPDGCWSYLSLEAIMAVTSDEPEAARLDDENTSDTLRCNWLSQADYESSASSEPSSMSSAPSPTSSALSAASSRPTFTSSAPSTTVSKEYRYRGRLLNLNKHGSTFCDELFPSSYGEESLGEQDGSWEVAALEELPSHPDLDVDLILTDITGVKRKIAFNLLAEHISFQILREGRHPANVILPWGSPVVGEWTCEKSLGTPKSIINLDRDVWAFLQGPSQERNARDFFTQLWTCYGLEDTCH